MNGAAGGIANRSVITVTMGAILGIAALADGQDASNFAQGSWSLSTYGSYTQSFTGERVRLAGGTVGLGYYVWENVSLNAEFSGFHVDQSGEDATLSDLGILLRQHLFHRGRFSFFVDVGGGLTYATHPTPPGGTYFNFTEETGLGATWQLGGNLHLIGGVRYFHLSNARIEGPERNPSINATQGYVGLMWSF
ncbi:MAG TPA: acyloxyacyl hydrolase [Tepidisphaeraceae bacterium]|nr:acyloxyacyl hydrolase [Tepidisphaeraceae bacterium]